VVDPIVSIGLSLWIFNETFTDDALRLGLAAAAFAGMCVAVIALVRTTPSTMERGADVRTRPVPGAAS
jgi:hypothetical protein